MELSFESQSSQPLWLGTLVALLRHRAQQMENRQAYTFLADTDEVRAEITYGELDRKARAIGALLQAAGAAGERVLLLYQPGLAYIQAFFGCLYAGAVAVPVYPPRHNRNLLRLQAIVGDVGSRFTLSTAAIRASSERQFAQTDELGQLQWLVTDLLAAGPEAHWQEPTITSDTLAFLQYTSGSTGTPKGVMLSHANLLHNLRLITAATQATDQDGVVSWLPPYHDMGLIGSILQPLYTGAHATLMSPAAFLQRPVRWLQAISDTGARISPAPNFAYDLCARTVTDEQKRALDLTRWEVALSGAEPIRRETMERFAAAFRECGFHSEAFYPAYGLAEATLMVTATRRGAGYTARHLARGELEKNRVVDLHTDEQGQDLISCGQTLPSQQVRIVHPDSLQLCGPDEVGEIWVCGPSVAQGYWSRPEETNRTFRATVSNTEETPFLRTGDLGFMSEAGELYVTGRMKDMIIIRGRNLYPQDVEATVERSHASVRPSSGAAFGVEVEGEERLVVVTEVERHLQDDAARIMAAIRQAVADEYEVQLYAIVLIRMASIPKTSSGKIQRHACKQGFLDGTLQVVASSVMDAAPGVAQAEVAPALMEEDLLTMAPQAQQALLQERLCKLVARVLKVPTDLVTGEIPLTALGADSLTAVEVAHAIEAQVGVSLPLTALLQGPTLHEMSDMVLRALRPLPTDATFDQQIRALARPDADAPSECELSHGQQALWFLHKVAPEASAYHVASAVRIRSQVDAAALERALQRLVDRHPMLRITITEQQGKAMQRIHPSLSISMRRQAAVGWSEAQIDAWLNVEAWRPFDLAQGPLVRAALLTCSDHMHYLLLVMHHMVIDFWSIAVLMRELAILYPSEVSGEAAYLPAPAIDYTDYVRWQRQMLASPQGEAHFAYWRQQLAGELPVLQLATDYARPPVQTYRGATRGVTISAELLGAVKALAREQRATLYMLLLAAFQVLLHRYTGQAEIIVGSPTTGRSGTRVADLVGYLVNSVALRADLSGNPAFTAFLAQVKQTVLEAIAHQDYPLSLLVDRLQPVRDPSRSPLFQVMFSHQHSHMLEEQSLAPFALGLAGEQIALGGLTLESVALEQPFSQCDLSLMTAEVGDTLAVICQYNTDLFAAATVDRLLTHFQRLLTGIVAAPAQPILQLPLLSDAELQQFARWNETTTAYNCEQTVHEQIAAQAARTPDAIAVVCREERLRYRELNSRANQVAHDLKQCGVGPDVLVALLMERSIDMVVALLGIMKAGGAYVPIDPTYPPDRLAYMLQDTGATVVLTQDRLAGGLQGGSARIVRLDTDWAQIALQPAENPESGAHPSNLIYVIYTSGSTGRPKGAMITHRGVNNYLTWCLQYYRVAEGAGAPVHSSIAFDLTVTSLLAPLVAGRSVTLIPDEAGVTGLYERLMRSQDLSLVKLTPAHLKLLAQQMEPAAASGHTNLFVIGGEPLTSQDTLFWQRYAPQTRLVNEYGPTETVVGCCIYEVPTDQPPGAIPIGRPIANTQLYLLDAYMQPVVLGAVGELYIGGAGVGRGYWRRPDLTAQRFVPDPFGLAPGARLYKTGDLARYRSDGTIEYLGRIDHQVKIHGYRIEVEEIEVVLAQHQDVREATVIVREDTPGAKRLVAYVTAAAGAPADEQQRSAELRAYLRERLPPYMLPSAVVTLPEMPLTPNGKVDRRVLPAPDEEHLAAHTDYVAPRTPAEERLAAIWADLLGVKQVGAHDNFFELGGDSILSIQVVARARQAGLHLSPQQIFQSPTVAALAAVAGQVELVQAEQAPVTGAVPLTPIQRRFFAYNLPDPHHFNQAVLLESPQALDPALLQQAIEALLIHHDALRMRYRCSEHAIEQVNMGPIIEREALSTLCWQRNLSALSDSEQAAALEAQAAEAQRSLNLAEGPLVRAVYFDLGADRPGRLLLVIHHLVVDGVSWRILLEDLQTGYAQLSRGEPVALPPKSTAFKRWAEQLHAYAGTAAVRLDLAYWAAPARREIAPLPTDRAGGPGLVATAATLQLELGARETQALLQEAPAAYRTQVNDLLLTALAIAMRRWTGQERTLIDLEGHGREELGGEIDLSRTVGWFTALYPVLLDLTGAAGPGEAIRAIKEQLRAVPQRGLSYGLLRDIGADEEAAELLRQMQQAEVQFNYLGQLDQAFASGGRFAPASESVGPMRSERGALTHLIDINALVAGGTLRIAWTYSKERYDEATIAALAQGYLEALRELIAHCQLPQAWGYTPSDFPLAGVTPAEIEAVVGALKAAAGEEVGRKIEALYPLTPVQQGMLFHTLMAPESGVYLIQLAFTLQGAFDGDGWREAWQQVVDRYAILRTAFVWEGVSAPLQVVLKQVSAALEQEDWQAVAAAEQRERLAARMQADRARGFLLTAAPLLRLTAIRLGQEAHRLIITLHHLVIDGWSLPVVLQEVLAAYEARQQQRRAALAPVRPFQDYIAWLQRVDPAALEPFWRERLRGFTAPTPLPTQGVLGRPAAEKPAGFAREEMHLPQEMVERLQALVRQNGLTLNAVLQGAWALLLGRYSGEEEALFGVTVSGRPPELVGVESMVGLFINTLPVRVALRADEGLLPWLRQIQAAQAAMQPYEHTALTQVQRWSEVSAGRSLFDSLLVFENYPLDRALQEQAHALQMSEIEVREQTNYPLTVTVIPGQRLLLRLDYDRQLFATATMQQMLAHLCMLLQGMAENLERPLAALPMITPAERQRLLVEWNETAAPYPRASTLHQLIEAQVEKSPDALAVIGEDEALTYRQLNQRANQLAHDLRKKGVGPDRYVAICMERSAAMVVGLLAILKAGGAYVPLDPAYPAERLAYMLHDAEPAVLLTTQEQVAALPTQSIERICIDTDWAQIAQESEANLQSDAGPEHLAYVIYTSGSTGRPKGVQIAHRSLVNFLTAMQQRPGATPADTWLSVTSISFDIAALEIYLPLITGGRVVLVSRAVAADGDRLLAALQETGATILQATPATWRLLLDAGWQGSDGLTMLCGGEALPRELIAPLLQRGAALWNMYGPTETTVWSAISPITSAQGPIAIGRPIANTQIYLLDRHLQPVPTLVTGELYIGGDGLARGYLNQPALTQERFIPDPFRPAPGARLYRTGDLARYMPDGNIECLGRIDHQVKLRGYRIELGEIESVLEQHPLVRQAVVAVHKGAEAHHAMLVAYLVAQEQAELTDELVHDVRAYLKERLPAHMIPAAYVMLREIPLTPNGKVDRKALPAPDSDRLAQASDHVPPRTPIERALAAIWSEVLGVAQVGAHTHFFEVGGHSLLATQVISRVRKATGADLPLRSLFEAPTVAALAERVMAALQPAYNPEAGPLYPVPRDGPLPLSFAQQRLWFLDQLQPGDPAYHIATAIRLTGALDVTALEQSLQAVVRRHESLRTTFVAIDGRPVQVIHPSPSFQMELVDLTQASERADEVAQAFARQPFDLTQDLMLRATLLQMGEDERLLLLAMHHIAADGWSLGVLVREVTEYYSAFVAGRPPLLAEMPVQYADVAAWQRRWLQGAALQKRLAYWKKRLEGVAVLELPTDRPRPAVQTTNGASLALSLSAALVARLQALSRQEGVTLFMTLLAAFHVLLHRYSGQDDISVGTPIANRNQVEMEGLIGLFVNTLVMRGDLSNNPPFRQFLGQVRETALGAYLHQDLPFEELVAALHPERLLSHAPLFQVMFVLQNAPMSQAELPGLRWQPVPIENHTAKFDLTLMLTEEKGGLTGSFTYNTDLFERATVQRLAGNLEVLLAAICENPDQPVSNMPILTADERWQLLVEWNETQVEYPQDYGIAERFERWAAQTPHALALVSGDRQLTYRELNWRANQLARWLRGRGVGPDVLVGLFVERSPEMIIGLLAILKAGGAYVPLDPVHSAERLAFVLEDASVPILLTQSSLLAHLSGQAVEALCLDADWPVIAKEESENLPALSTPKHLVYVIYTSGSTGRPKGVAVSAKNLLNYVDAICDVLDLPPGSSYATISTVAADLGNTTIFPSLCTGGTLHLLTPEMAVDPQALASYFQQHPVDCLKIVPTHLSALLASPQAAQLLPRRRLVMGGESLRWDLVDEIHRLAPACTMINHYGPTETTVGVLTHVIDPESQAPRPRAVPLGRPLANAQMYILDQRLQPVPIGVAGELYIGGTCVTRGYLNRPELTAERFIASPFEETLFLHDQRPITRPPEMPQGRLYKTGDLVRYLPNGQIEFLGRTDFQVKIRGFRIELGEVEATLSQHPAVRNAVALVREGASGSQRLVAYIVPRGKSLAADGVIDFVRKRLPDYMVPSAVVTMPAFPLMANGKVERRALPAPDGDPSGRSAEHVAPRTPAEEILADIWMGVLGVTRVGMYDNFFELGGDSILSIQVVARAAQKGLRLTPKQIFEMGTIAKLAAVAVHTEGVQAEQGLVTGPVPLTPIQVAFFEQRRVDSHHDNQAMLLEVRQRMEPALLERAIEALLLHHDALRLRYVQTEQGVEQINEGAPTALPFSVLDLSQIAEPEQSAAVEARAAAVQQSLNLSAGPLLRAVLFDLGAQRAGRLLLVIHHLAVDGISWRILLEDLQTAYRQLSQGEPVRLPPKSTSFKLWAERLTAYARSAAPRQEAPYWLQAQRKQAPGLPVDRDEELGTLSSSALVEVELDAEETRALLQEVTGAYRTQVGDLLLTALVRACAAWTGERSLLLDLEGHGREEVVEGVDLSRTVGWFTSIYPVVLHLDGADGPGEEIKAIKEQLRAVPSRGLSYGLLRYLSADDALQAEMRAAPHPQIRFNYLGQFDTVLAKEALLAPAKEQAGPTRSERGPLLYAIDILGSVSDGRLRLAWRYSTKRYDHATIERLTEAYLEALRALVAHCVAPGAGGYTPSDFPLAHLDDDAIRAIVAQMEAASGLTIGRNIEEIYPLSPTQKELLARTLAAPKSGVYAVQYAYTLRGDLVSATLARAWQQVVQQHAILRTAFVWRGLSEPLQVVLRYFRLALERRDWSKLSQKEQEEQLAALMLAERTRGFNPAMAPLMRLKLIRLGPDSYRFLLTKHHLLTDGWSSHMILKEVLTCYAALRQGERISLGHGRAYRDYITWLQQQDPTKAEAYWRRYLQAFMTPTPVLGRVAARAEKSGSITQRQMQRWLSTDLTQRLQAMVRRHGLTMNTVAQGAWAMLLSEYSGQEDVLFGTMASGRSADLPGIESVVGLLMNALPVRIRVVRNGPLLPWLAQIQEQQAEMRQYEHTAPERIRRCSEIESGAELFDSMLVFENYPIDAVLQEQQVGLEISDVVIAEQYHYPLTLWIVPGEALCLRVAYESRRYTEPEMQQALDRYCALLAEIADKGEQRA